MSQGGLEGQLCRGLPGRRSRRKSRATGAEGRGGRGLPGRRRKPGRGGDERRESVPMGPERFPELKRKASVTRRVTLFPRNVRTRRVHRQRRLVPQGWGEVGGCYQAFWNWRWWLRNPENGLNAAQVCALQWGCAVRDSYRPHSKKFSGFGVKGSRNGRQNRRRRHTKRVGGGFRAPRRGARPPVSRGASRDQPKRGDQAVWVRCG